MAKAHIHAMSSARRWGGDAEDYMDLHDFMDSSKGTLPDNRHRALTHNAWFISVVIPRVFGSTFVNSAGRTVSTKDVAEQHVLEDFRGRFIPTAQDFLERMEYASWMDGRKDSTPSSHERIEARKITTSTYID